jgi:hypothetical protein
VAWSRGSPGAVRGGAAPARQQAGHGARWPMRHDAADVAHNGSDAKTLMQRRATAPARERGGSTRHLGKVAGVHLVA